LPSSWKAGEWKIEDGRVFICFQKNGLQLELKWVDAVIPECGSPTAFWASVQPFFASIGLNQLHRRRQEKNWRL